MMMMRSLMYQCTPSLRLNMFQMEPHTTTTQLLHIDSLYTIQQPLPMLLPLCLTNTELQLYHTITHTPNTTFLRQATLDHTSLLLSQLAMSRPLSTSQ